MYYAMFDKDKQSTMASKAHRGMPCEIKNYPHGTVKINTLMKGWLQALNEHPVLCAGLFEVRFLTTQTEDAVIVGCYKKPLTAEWQTTADLVANQLHVKIVGRSRKVKMIAGASYSFWTALLFTPPLLTHLLQSYTVLTCIFSSHDLYTYV